jgi:hypothetical protein
MKPHVSAVFDLAQDFYNASGVYAGLDVLARSGEIRLELQRAGPHEQDLVQDPLTVCLRVQRGEQAAPTLLAIDLHDQSDAYCREALRRCDVCFKRSFHRSDLAGLPAELAAKVRPLGLNYPCRTRGSTLRLLRRAGLGLILRGSSGWRRLRLCLVLPQIAAFEQPPNTKLEPTVVFQTRVWEPHETGDGECQAINEGRVALIRALRDEFGERFRGGLVPTSLALEKYPAEVSRFRARRSLYIAMSKRNLIGVYSRGLHQSTAFKLPEYLAASQCIVAEPPRNESPQPLEAGRHFLPFQTPEECVAACRRLLADERLAAEMRRANHDYYRSEVEPAAHLRNVIGCESASV